MFPFWDDVIAPIFDAVGANRVVEIGALRGSTTVQMLERLGAEAELHVIDPVPEFDPSVHEREFPGRYIFHRDLSLNVLPGLTPPDVALIDGDHNWYTVYNELRLLAEGSREAGAELPVLILHDVGWPYGRRDLYYAPETIPEDHRQPYAQLGIVRDKPGLAFRGGLNPTMNNAKTEGGPRNGVLTALEDFVAEYEHPVRLVMIPVYWGLAVVAAESRLERQPRLAELLDWLESAQGRGRLLELGEELRLKAMVVQHNAYFTKQRLHDRHAERYLDLLKGALLDEHYLENELRIDHLAWCAQRGQKPDQDKLRDPLRHMRQRADRFVRARAAGQLHDDEGEVPAYFPYTTMGRARLDQLHECLDTVRQQAVAGDLVEVGTGRGGGAIFLHGYLEARDMMGPQLWVADEFHTGEHEAMAAPLEGVDLRPDLNGVREALDRFDLLSDRVRFIHGDLGPALAGAPIEKIALLRIGSTMKERVEQILEELYERVSVGGYVLVDGYADPRTRTALESFRGRHGVGEVLERADWTGVAWRKLEQLPTRAGRDPDAPDLRERPQTRAAPLAQPAPAGGKDLSVVVVFYNMRREAERTLHALSRSYQERIEDLDYEVLVVENGSAPDQRLGEDFVRGFGPQFRYLDLGENAQPSPVHALNRGIDASIGEHLALMIDGAHVLTPGVLRYGMAGLRTYGSAIVMTQQWYVGPEQQPDAVRGGYDQEYEDELFDQIDWPVDGYRLFDVGHFIGDRDWLDGMWESNCLFVPRKLLEQVGGLDERFSMPGGGYANLELYERLAASPDVTVVTILGEGSFHQVHGGTTTNEADARERNQQLASFAQHYGDVRGRGFVGPGKTFHYVGQMTTPALRTRARRRVARNLWTPRSREGRDGMPDKPTPIPTEIKTQFTESLWRSFAWKKTRWLGNRVRGLPSDLFVYQEILHDVRPDWIVEIGTDGGGRTMFLATICDMLGHGRIISVDEPGRTGEEHDRITYLEGRPMSREIVSRVEELVGTPPKAMVILGKREPANRTVRQFDLYSPLVPAGSYLVIEETIVNGHPVWAKFGPGPMEAVKRITNRRGDFAPDHGLEKYGVTFHPHGFLRRLPDT